MSEMKSRTWLFANKPAGSYQSSVWDMSMILQSSNYSIKESEKNRARVQPGDVVYMRIYRQGFIGRFVIGGEWRALNKRGQQSAKSVVGVFPMTDVEIWSHCVPQSLVFGDLSNQNHRMRIARATPSDVSLIECARKICGRLSIGGVDGEVVVLERGLEEALKPSLPKLGLQLADKRIRQQFSMGVGVGRSDLICSDESGDLVVVELKRGLSSDQVVGQILSYIGWLRENVAQTNQSVKGIIVTGDYDERLRLAAKAAGIRVILVRLG